MLILTCLFTLSAFASPVLVGSFDTQFDMDHETIRGRMWVNPGETPNDGIDNDQNGYADDVNGWNFADNNNVMFEPDLNIFNADNIKYGEYAMRRRAGVATSEELAWLNQNDSTLGVYHRAWIGYLHGTSSASVILKNTKQTRVIGLRINTREEFIFDPHAPTPTPTPEEIPENTPFATEEEIESVRAAYVDDTFKLFKDSIEYATAQGARIIQYGIMMNLYSGSARSFQRFLYSKTKKLVPLARAQIAAEDYYKTLISKGTELYNQHPDVLFVTAAGNGADDLDKLLAFPQGVRTENTLNVGASRFHDDITPFSGFGKTTVDALIPTVNYYVAVPNQGYMMSSATSVSVVIAANLAALIMEENPLLTSLEVKKIILSTVIKRSNLADKTVTGGIIYHDRALEAARNSRFMNLNEAIARAFETVKN